MFINIPKEIGDRTDRLRLALSQLSPFMMRSCHDVKEPMYYMSIAERKNCYILQEWIWVNDKFRIDNNTSWKSLADVLVGVGIKNDELEHCLRLYSGPPKMSTLLNFPVSIVKTSANIPREVGVKYFSFGTHLLQDVTGAHIRTLEHELNRNGELINQRILQEWLSGEGRPVTWATLVEVLNIIEMGELAKKIEDKYINTKAAAVSTQ